MVGVGWVAGTGERALTSVSVAQTGGSVDLAVFFVLSLVLHLAEARAIIFMSSVYLAFAPCRLVLGLKCIYNF